MCPFFLIPLSNGLDLIIYMEFRLKFRYDTKLVPFFFFKWNISFSYLFANMKGVKYNEIYFSGI